MFQIQFASELQIRFSDYLERPLDVFNLGHIKDLSSPIRQWASFRPAQDSKPCTVAQMFASHKAEWVWGHFLQLLLETY